MILTKEQIDDMRTSFDLGTQPFTREAIDSLCYLALKGLSLTDPEANAPQPEARPSEWTLVPKDEPLGAFLTCQPGKPVYAIDERGVPINTPFRVWKIEMPELPPVSEVK